MLEHCRKTGWENSECICDVLGGFFPSTLSISLQRTCDVLDQNTTPCPQCNHHLQPFTTKFPHADIYELLTLDLLHQAIKGTYKDHLVTWVEEYLKKVHSPSRGSASETRENTFLCLFHRFSVRKGGKKRKVCTYRSHVVNK